MAELRAGTFAFGDNETARKRFVRQCEESKVRYALRSTDTGMVVDALGDTETMPCLTEAYRKILKIK